MLKGFCCSQAYLSLNDLLRTFFMGHVFFLQIGHNTAISLARRSRELIRLDLSWCRNLTDGDLGFIVDSCLSLRVLKLFGCTQVLNLVRFSSHTTPSNANC